MIRSLQLILFSAFVFAFSGKYIFFTQTIGPRVPSSGKTKALSFIYADKVQKSEIINTLEAESLDLEKLISEFDRPYLSPKQNLYYLSLANDNRSLKNYLKDYDDDLKALVQPNFIKNLKDFKINPKVEPILYHGILNEMNNNTDSPIFKYFTVQSLSEQNIRLIKAYRPIAESIGASPTASKLSVLDFKEWEKLDLAFSTQKIGLTTLESKYQTHKSPLSVISIDLQKMPPSKGSLALNISYGALKKDELKLGKKLGLPLKLSDNVAPLAFLGVKEDFKVIYLVKRISLNLVKDSQEKYKLIFNPQKSIISSYEFKELDVPRDFIAFIKDGYRCESGQLTSKAFIPKSSRFICWKKVKANIDDQWSKILLKEAALSLTHF